MSIEESKTLMRRVVDEVFNRGDLAVADETFDANFVEHVPVPPGFPSVSGKEIPKQWATLLRKAFPDFHYTIEDVVAEGDKVVARLTASGTHRGDFLGTPATGKRVTWSEIHIGRVVNGKFAEHWANVDQLGMMQQMGVVPMPGQQPQRRAA